jgi:hypothetical protein
MRIGGIRGSMKWKKMGTGETDELETGTRQSRFGPTD